jgi:hypothetical protein
MEQLNALNEQFASRGCKTEISERTSQTLAGDNVIKREHLTLIVQVPEERQFKTLFVSDTDKLQNYAELKIYTFRFINGYRAIWSMELGIIECEIEYENAAYFFQEAEFDAFPHRSRFGTFVSPHLFYPTDKVRKAVQFPHYNNIKIEIGDWSDQFQILEQLQRKNYTSLKSRRFTIRLEGLKIDTHEEAMSKLLKISNSALFQFDLKTGLQLRLIMEPSKNEQLLLPHYDISAGVEFSAPTYEYDPEPIALYMYARSAAGMPLLKYLAFYQVLEFYFPVYSLSEARQKIKNFIKNPLFDPNRDTDIAQIINLIKTSSKGKSIGDERSQIKATIQGIIDQQVLMDFFNEDSERKDFFDQQKKSRGIAKQRINFTTPDNDIRIEVALRVYEIRCRVVHAKDDENFELLLPYSKELVEMDYDLQLIHLLAQKAIIAGSRPMNI